MVFTLSKKELPLTRITEPEAYKQLGGKDIDMLLIKADKQREVLWKEGLIDTYSVHAIYNAETGDWKGHLYNYETYIKTAEKEVQDTSCRGSGGAPQLYKSPKIGGLGG